MQMKFNIILVVMVQETLRMMEMAVMVTSFQIQNLSKQSSSSAPFQNRHPHQSFSMSVVIMPPNLGTLAQPKYTYEYYPPVFDAIPKAVLE